MLKSEYEAMSNRELLLHTGKRFEPWRKKIIGYLQAMDATEAAIDQAMPVMAELATVLNCRQPAQPMVPALVLPIAKPKKPAKSRRQPRIHNDRTIREAIIEACVRSEDGTMSAEQIASAIDRHQLYNFGSSEPRKRVSQEMTKLVRNGDIERVSQGMYKVHSQA